MGLKLLEKRTETYEDVTYVTKVYFAPETAYSDDDSRYIVVEPKFYEPTIDSVRSHEPLNPSSILPWKNPQPRSKEKQVVQTESQFKRNVDRQQRLVEKANGGDG